MFVDPFVKSHLVGLGSFFPSLVTLVPASHPGGTEPVSETNRSDCELISVPKAVRATDAG